MDHLAFKATNSLKSDGCNNPMDLLGPCKHLISKVFAVPKGNPTGCQCLHRIHNPAGALSKEKAEFTMTYIFVESVCSSTPKNIPANTHSSDKSASLTVIYLP